MKNKVFIAICVFLSISCMTLALICFNLFQENKELKKTVAENETRINSLEMFVDSLQTRLSDDSSYNEWLEKIEKKDKEVAEKWNKNNPDNPISEETLLPE